MNWKLPDVQARFRQGRGTRDQIVNIHKIIEKSKEFQENIYFFDYTKALDYVDHNNFGEFWKRWKHQTTLCAPWETCLQAKKQQ